MAQPEVTQQTDNSKAHWQDSEVDVLLHHLVENQAAGSDGGNFSMPTYNSAVAAINADQAIQTIGPLKTGKMVKMKWTLLKKTFNQIQIYRGISGFHWDNIHRAGIEGVAAASVWDTYVAPKSQITMRPFRNKGWPLYNDMQAILGDNSDDVLDGADRALDLLNIDVDPSGGSVSVGATPKHLHTNTLPDSLETSSHNSGGMSSIPDSHQSPSLLLSSTLVPSSQVPIFKKAQVLTHCSSIHTGMSSAAKVTVKITPVAVVMNMQGSINHLTDAIEKNMAPLPDLPIPVVPVIPTLISHGLAVMRSVDGDLSFDQRATLLQIFSRAGGENNLAVYIGLEDDFDVHRAFISGLLDMHSMYTYLQLSWSLLVGMDLEWMAVVAAADENCSSGTDLEWMAVVAAANKH
ncbi:uncharacterized protein EDB93DRAFT_1255635 [Suillus bovinus]|uniref:uncharacterized protein n=1 Tax=Suillus bovinus TaxID=48563 RepID=UPI001B86B972|nr:uncharacterized protein EDB93DRAFT_1255635 [Suillus bovinus]KAG2130979.1 hypothetical protein EDB93DRAFT_1255635 [Suillus bovinus]